MMSGFEARSAVVTGAAGGIGYSVACMLVAEGAAVTMIDLKDPPPVPAGAGSAVYRQGDVTDAGFVAQAIGGLDAVDHLVNAAGVLWRGRDVGAVDIDLAVWDRVVDINLRAAVLTLKAAVPKMRAAGGGSIVNVSTIQCLRGDPVPQDAYQAAKAGVIALTRSIAIQYAAEGIRANCVLPGQTRTGMQPQWQDDAAALAQAAKAVPLGRVGEPEDVADAILFLLSDRAGFITGTELIVDGGCMAKP